METQKHSRLGIASLVLGITSAMLCCVLLCGFFLFATENVALKAIRGWEAGFLVIFVMGMLYYSLMGISVIGIGLGIAGVFAKERKRVFAVWGLALSALAFLIAVVISMPLSIFLQ